MSAEAEKLEMTLQLMHKKVIAIDGVQQVPINYYKGIVANEGDAELQI